MKTWIKLVILATLSGFAGCGKAADQQGDGGAKSAASSLPQAAIKTAQTTAPKDAETPAEQGGYGFEKVAAQLGYQTYTFTEQDAKFFGDSRAVKGGVLNSITSRYPVSLRTQGQNAGYSENTLIETMLYESLIALHPVSQEFIPSLASHWKISDDKMQFWFRINPDARWSDGQPVVADDVIATWKLLMDETILESSSQLTYGKFEQPVAQTKYIVAVKARELNWRNFLYFGSNTAIFPAHVIGNMSGTDYLQQYQSKVLPGTGPYTILESDVQTQVSFAFTRRLDYWDAENPAVKFRYNFDKIKFETVKDNPSLEYEKFKKGEQDFFVVMHSRRWVEETDYKDVQKGWVQKRRVFSQKPSGMQGYGLNMRKWPFNDKRIRKALMYLFNREKLIEELFYGQYIVQNSMFAGSVYENPNNEKVVYSPEKGQALLAEAGFKKRNADGWLVNDAGKVLQFEIGVEKSNDFVITPFQQMLKEYGIDMQIKFADGNALWKSIMDRSFTMYSQGWGGLNFPNPETMWHSSLADQNDNNNIYGFKNARIDEICALYDKEFDQKKRIELIREIDGIVMAECPMLLSHYAPYTRLLFWNKFGYPEYMVDRYQGDYRSVFYYWWFDPDKIAQLDEAQKKDQSLPVGEVEVKYWLDFAEKEKTLSDAGK